MGFDTAHFDYISQTSTASNSKHLSPVSPPVKALHLTMEMLQPKSATTLTTSPKHHLPLIQNM